MTDAPRAYLGSFTSAGGLGLTTATVAADSGALRAVHHTATLPDPSYLALAPDGRTLYAVSERPDGRAAAFSLADPDRPALVAPAAPVGGAGPTHLAVAGGLLVTAHYGSGSISALRLRAADGAPTGAPVVRRHRGAGPVTARQEGPHAHAVVPSPNSRWLLAVDLGADAVWVYAHAGGVLRPHHQVHLPAGCGPRHLAFHPDGRRAYVVGELAATLVACRWDPAAGALRPVGETATVPPGATAPTYPSGIAVTPDGTRAYVANRGDDSIAVFALGEPGRPVVRVTTVPCQGAWPRALTLSPDGRRLYVANERSGDVTWFDLPAPDGIPRPAGSLPAPAVSCVVLR